MPLPTVPAAMKTVHAQISSQPQHPMSMLDNFSTKYLSMESTVNRLGMQMRQPAKLRCTMICRKSSLILSSWFKKRRLVAGPIAGPDLVKFFEDVELDNNWEQTVPPAILMQLGLQNSHSIGGGAAPVP